MIKIRETRKEKNITCDDLARKIGITKQAISQAEMLHNRMLTPDKAKILSDFFGKPIYYFVDFLSLWFSLYIDNLSFSGIIYEE